MTRRYSLLLLATLATGPAPALAQQGGINLSWNDCGTYGQSVETFACNTNAGTHRLVASFVSPVPLTQFVAIELVVDMFFVQPVPSWWMAQSGGCRSPAITANANFTGGPSSCADPWTSQVISLANVVPGFNGPNRVRLRAVAAVPSDTPQTVDDVTEYYALEFVIGNQKTVGPQACAGCQEPACVFLQSIKLGQAGGAGDYTLSNQLSSQLVGWQCQAFIGHGGCYFDPYSCSTPTRNPTWGSIKGMYR